MWRTMVMSKSAEYFAVVMCAGGVWGYQWGHGGATSSLCGDSDGHRSQ